MIVAQLFRRLRHALSPPVLLVALGLILLAALGSFHLQSPSSSWIGSATGEDDGYGLWEVEEVDVSSGAEPAPPGAVRPHPAGLPTTGDPATKAGEHKIKGGFLEVDPSVPATQHPISQLISTAKAAWEAKKHASSGTLKAAVKEYKRRHGGRNPPKGFDRWWTFVVDNNVQLPDEYDRIMKDLAPFRGLSASALRKRLKHLQSMRDTFTLSLRNGELAMHSETFDPSIVGAQARAQGQFDFIKDVVKDIPNFDAVFSIHDTPTQFVSYNHLMELQQADEDGEPFEEGDEGDRSFSNWGSACPPGSPLHEIHEAQAQDPSRLNPSYKDAEAVKGADTIFMGWKPLPELTEAELDYRPMHLKGGKKSFVWSQDGMMDLCANADLVELHGAMNGLHPVASPKLQPIFSLSKTNLHSDITVIPIEQWGEDPGAKAWKDKTENKLLWRGRNTGGYAAKNTPWRSAHRPRIAHMAFNDLQDPVEILPPPTWVAPGSKKLKDVLLERPHGELNRDLLNVGLAYDPIQCSHSDGTCDEIKAELKFSDALTFEEETNYRYILDIDGNAWSARFHRLLISRAVIVKNSVFPEWFNDRIQPWVHFVPTKLDFEDLYDIMSFFRGDGKTNPGQEALAQEIAESGRQWALTFWRREDMTAYMFRLYLEWARLLADDRSSMDFIVKE